MNYKRTIFNKIRLIDKLCTNCHQEFPIRPKDEAYYRKVDVPPPAYCLDCRKQRRLAQGNQIHLYTRNCDATSKSVITNYAPNSSYKIYDQAYWHSDKWDAVNFGRDFDFTRPFFEQFQELSLVVPRPNLQTAFHFDENSEYTNYAGKNKNCYLIFDSDENWDCSYCYSTNNSKDTIDCYRVKKCEICYECIDCENCYHSYFLQDSENCVDSAFLKNSIGCNSCFMSSNIRNKQYYIRNRQSTKKEYENLMVYLKSHTALEEFKKEFAALKLQFPQKYMHGTHNETVTGDYLVNCKNAEFCFDSRDLWDCTYFDQSFMDAKDSMDVQECGDKAELLYETCFSGYSIYNLKFCMFCLSPNRNLQYCSHCFHCDDCFGCVGLKRKKFCILNKQYSEEEYRKMLPRVIEHMKNTREYGEFFPITLSCFAYNESMAQDYYPLAKETALQKGYRWRDDDKKVYAPAEIVLPDSIDEVDESCANKRLTCEECGRNYKIVPQELMRYMKLLKIATPRKCFFCRHRGRRSLRNPRKLWNRTCTKCNVPITTSYTPDQPEIVYCEKCYFESIY